jgi:hypothetical protein
MHQLTWLGVAFILIGVALIILPVIGKYLDLSRIPPWLIYIYRGNGFYFVTSPLLLVLSIVFLLLYFLRR